MVKRYKILKGTPLDRVLVRAGYPEGKTFEWKVRPSRKKGIQSLYFKGKKTFEWQK